MKIEKVLSYKELKEMTKKGDVELENVCEIRMKASTSFKGMYVRIHSIKGKVLVWRSHLYNGLWLSSDNASLYFCRGYVIIESDVN